MSESIHPDEERSDHLRMLLTSAGRRVALLDSFRAAAGSLGVRLEVFACDQSPEFSAACHKADRAFSVPPASDEGYGHAIFRICEEYGISLVVPTIDPELLPLSRLRNGFESRNIMVSVGSPVMIEIARDKLKTSAILEAHDIPVPRTAPAESASRDPEAWEWPLFLKPRHGSSGRLASIISDAAALAKLPGDEPFVVQELLDGPEFTVNMFFDRSGTLLCAIPHERLQVRAGEVEKGITRRMPQLQDIAWAMVDILPQPRGALCFQARAAADGTFRVFEINARFGGGYPLADRAGATFTRWLLEERLGRPLTANDNWSEGVMMLRYDAAVYSES